MKLKELTISNFKNITKLTQPISKGITIILGEDGTGKSAISSAIYTAITGKTPTNPASDYIKTGNVKAEINLIIDVPGRKSTYLGRDIQKDKSRSASNITQDKLFEQMGVKAQLIEASLNTRSESIFDKDNRITLLRDTLGGNLTIESAEEKIKNLEEYKSSSQTFLTNFVSDFKSSSKSITDFLTARARAPRSITKSHIEKSKEAVDKFDTEITSVQKLIDEKGQDNKDNATKQEQLAELNHTKTSISIDIKICLDECKSRELNLIDIMAKLNQLGTRDNVDPSKEEELNAKFARLTGKLDITKSNIRGLKSSLETIESCSSPSEISCIYFGNCKYEQASNDIPTVKQNITTKILQKEKELAETQAEYNTLADNISWVSNYNKVDRLKLFADERIAMANTKLSELSNKSTEVSNQIMKLAKEIGPDNGISSLRDTLKTVQLSKQDAEHTMTRETSELKFLDKSIEMCDNGDFSGQYNQEILHTLMTNLAYVFPEFTDFEVGSDGDILVNKTSARTLSLSQSFKFGIALQLTAAEHSGFGIAIIDGLNIVSNPTTVSSIMNLIISKKDKLDHIIVTSSRSDSFHGCELPNGTTIIKTEELPKGK